MNNEFDDQKQQFFKYICNNCQNTMFSKSELTTCVFCGENLNEKIDGQTINNYSHIIPFVVSKDDVIKNYKKRIMFNPIVPFVFKSKKVMQSISTIYIPEYLISTNVSGDVSFLAGDKQVIDNKKNTVTKKYRVKDYSNIDYNDILINLWSKIDNALFVGAFTYDYSQLKELNSNEFDDIVIGEDINLEEELTSLNTKILNNSLSFIKNSVKHDLKKVSENNLQIKLLNYKKILVPVYFLNVNYKGKNYQYIGNGQNGKDIFNFPIGILELVIFSLLLFLIIFAVAFLFAKIL